MSTATDELVDLDVDIDASIPCVWTGCKEDPTHLAFLFCEAGAVHELPLCSKHLEQTAAWYSRLEWFIKAGFDPHGLPHQVCKAHGSLVRMRGSRPL